MNSSIVTGFIIGGCIIIATVIWIYFSPFQICVRIETEFNIEYYKNKKTTEEIAQNARYNCLDVLKK